MENLDKLRMKLTNKAGHVFRLAVDGLVEIETIETSITVSLSPKVVTKSEKVSCLVCGKKFDICEEIPMCKYESKDSAYKFAMRQVEKLEYAWDTVEPFDEVDTAYTQGQTDMLRDWLAYLGIQDNN